MSTRSKAVDRSYVTRCLRTAQRTMHKNLAKKKIKTIVHRMKSDVCRYVQRLNLWYFTNKISYSGCVPLSATRSPHAPYIQRLRQRPMRLDAGRLYLAHHRQHVGGEGIGGRPVGNGPLGGGAGKARAVAQHQAAGLLRC